MAERKTLLIPSLLDDWFPLLQYAFASERWEPVLLTEDDPHLADLGLKYFHNELCYPVFLVAGQVLSALGSGRYDPARCGVLFGQAGDECRGSCGIRLLRRVLDRMGYGQVETLSPNVRDIDRDTGLPITAAMVRRCLAAAVWGDALALLRNQTRPHEAVPGAAEALFCALTLEEGYLPATINYQVPDPACDLDVVPNQGRSADVRYALSNSLGFGGHNGSLLFKKWEV